MVAMRQTLIVAGLFALLVATEAQAQFQNKSIGVSVGFVDLLFEIDGIIAHTSAPTDPNIWGLNVTPIGVRYLFLEDTFRPYLGLDASYLHFFASDASTQVIGSSG